MLALLIIVSGGADADGESRGVTTAVAALQYRLCVFVSQGSSSNGICIALTDTAMPCAGPFRLHHIPLPTPSVQYRQGHVHITGRSVLALAAGSLHRQRSETRQRCRDAEANSVACLCRRVSLNGRNLIISSLGSRRS